MKKKDLLRFHCIFMLFDTIKSLFFSLSLLLFLMMMKMIQLNVCHFVCTAHNNIVHIPYNVCNLL